MLCKHACKSYTGTKNLYNIQSEHCNCNKKATCIYTLEA